MKSSLWVVGGLALAATVWAGDAWKDKKAELKKKKLPELKKLWAEEQEQIPANAPASSGEADTGSGA